MIALAGLGKDSAAVVTVIAPVPPPEGGMANQAKLLLHCLEIEGIHVRLIPTNSSPPDSWIERIPVLRTLVREWFFLARVLWALRRTRVFHVFACSHLYYYLHVVPCVVMAHIAGTRVLVNYRGGDAEDFFSGVARYFVWVLRWADEVVVPSGFLQRVLEKRGVQASILPNISELERFTFRTRTVEGAPRYVCTRNFEGYYDIPTLIRAFRIVRDEKAASLTLVGDGSQAGYLRELVNELGLDESVTFKGPVGTAEIPACLDEADIFVNSSRVDNYPISILEAFAAGLPVVSTAAGGIPYLVQDGENGLLVPPENACALAAAMLRVAAEPRLAESLAQAGLKTAATHGWPTIWEVLKHSYCGDSC